MCHRSAIAFPGGGAVGKGPPLPRSQEEHYEPEFSEPLGVIVLSRTIKLPAAPEATEPETTRPKIMPDAPEWMPPPQPVDETNEPR